MVNKLVLVLVFLTAIANTGVAQGYKNEFGFKNDNDAYLFNKQDRYYTNGLFITFRSAIPTNQDSTEVVKKIWEISLAQKIFNPSSGSSPISAFQDRPFAGQLYANIQKDVYYKNESLFTFGANIGIVGPASLAKQSQEALHQAAGFYKVEGWEYQIKNTFAFNILGQYNKLIFRNTRNSIDLTSENYASLGTTNIFARMALSLRLGQINSLANTAYYNSLIGNNNSPLKNKAEFYAFIKPQLSYIGYDATIQGSLFNDNSPVTFGAKPLVFSQAVGATYSNKRFTLNYALYFLSKEVKSYASSNQYGSISLFYRFN